MLFILSIFVITNKLSHIVALIWAQRRKTYRIKQMRRENVSVIDSTTNSVIATIPVGSGPQFIAFNPNNGDMYVTNRGSNDVSVIAPITTTWVQLLLHIVKVVNECISSIPTL
jgi:YVTN family beta-propeller protein